jgi:hypothetical protein
VALWFIFGFYQASQSRYDLQSAGRSVAVMGLVSTVAHDEILVAVIHGFVDVRAPVRREDVSVICHGHSSSKTVANMYILLVFTVYMYNTG